MDAKDILQNLVAAVQGRPTGVKLHCFDGGIRVMDLAMYEEIFRCDPETVRAALREGACTDSRYYSGNESPVLSEADL